jgi:hypothetical protein
MQADISYMLVAVVNRGEICFNYGTKLHVVRIKIKINMKMTALVLFVLALVCFLVLLDI